MNAVERGRGALRRAMPCLVIAAASVAAGCGGPTPRLALPTGPGQAVDDPAGIASRVFERCADVRTLTAEIGVSGRAGRQKLRGKLIAGFEAPASLRLEAVAPFGAPGFILAADGSQATLLLPRDDRVLTGARPADILEALAGLSLSPTELRLLLAGCPADRPVATGGSTFGSEWTVLELAAGGTAYLRGQPLRLAALVRPGLVVEYPERTAAGAPVVVRLRDDAEAPRFDVALRLAQVEVNVDVPAEAFRVKVPPAAVPITLEELREAGPLGEARQPDRGTR